MNLGKLVRAKMKELKADLSGDYIDGQGKHYVLKLNGDGYTVSYGGAQREISATKEQASKLVAHSKKMKADESEDKKELSKKRLAKSTADILKIANQVESSGAGNFDRVGKDMNIWFRGDGPTANENARRVASAIGSQAGSPINDRISGKVVLKVKNVYQ